MKNIYAAMSVNGQVARVGIEEVEKGVPGRDLAFIDLTAGELSTAINNLAQVRAKMADKFVMPDPGGIVFHDTTRKARYIIGREHVTSREVYAAFLHPGYGWLCFTMEEEPAAAFVLMMSQNVATMKPRIVKPPNPPGGKIII